MATGADGRFYPQPFALSLPALSLTNGSKGKGCAASPKAATVPVGAARTNPHGAAGGCLGPSGGRAAWGRAVELPRLRAGGVCT